MHAKRIHPPRFRRRLSGLLCLIAMPVMVAASDPYQPVIELINWEYPGLEAGAAAVAEERWEDAAAALLRHFRTRGLALPFSPDEPLRDLDAIPGETHDTTTLEEVMRRRFTFERETVPFEEGIDWRRQIYDREWAYMFHRHTHFLTLVEGFRRHGDETFMEEFAWQLREWHRQVPPDHPRTLETGLRLRHWTVLFPSAVRSRHFDAALLAIFLGDLHAMAESLNNRESGYRRGNWGTMEATGVLFAGTVFPEFKRAEDWRRSTIDLLPDHFRRATYGDAVYRGRSPHYHNVILRQMHLFLRLLEVAGETPPPEFLEHFHLALDFAGAYTRPDLSIPQFGDSDNDPMRDRLLTWIEPLDRPDLLFVATEGRRGTRPDWSDRLFAEGGFAVLRSDWDDGPDARWLMFDFGPRGRGQFRIGSVDLAAYGRPLVVMPGRYRYHTEDGSRALFVSTPFQNTVSINGENQQANPPLGLARQRMEGKLKVLHAWHQGYSHLTADGDTPGPPVTHERQVVMVRDAFWIVADRVRTDPRRFAYAQNWRFQPNELVPLPSLDRAFVTTYPEANILLAPLESPGKAVVREGWYSPKYGVREQAPWLAYEHESETGYLFFTLLAPFPGDEVPLKQVAAGRDGDSLRVRLEWVDGRRDEVEIAFGAETGTGANGWEGWLNGNRIGRESFE